MNGLFAKVGRMISVAALLMVAVTVGGAVAQKRPTGGAIGVGKCKLGDPDCFATYNKIQDAVNAARGGDVIEILDEGVYEEQVTIYGEEGTNKWDGVVGGNNKNGITIRYVPAGGAGAAWNHPRPTIKYRDTKNTSPRTDAEAGKPGDQVGTSGNFETCGALRIIRAKGVTIEGIAIDGGGAYAFGAKNVWKKVCNNNTTYSHLFHGNAAVALAVAGGVTIRDCDLKNAYFGISIKDRNTGGVFGNPNPSDNDQTVPLSGFGKVGGHLFEYNRVSGNVMGFFFESAWDLGSTVRYNLIYNNKRNKTLIDAVDVEKDNQNGGAFMFKDMYLSPVAIYNNTLYDNTGNFCGNWQVGGQHLIFNNIFSKSSPADNPANSHMALDSKFPYRMHNCVFSAAANQIQVENRPEFNCAANAALAPGGAIVNSVQFTGFVNPAQSQVTLTNCTANRTEQRTMVAPGALITALQGNPAVTFGASYNIRWLQTEGGGGLPSLFKSISPNDADFLVPNWDHDAVKNFIKNKGWADAGIRNNDGSLADLGAIPSTGVRQTTVTRIIPTDVVILSGSGTSYTGKTKFNLKLESGNLTGLSVKMLRWIAPIPNNKQAADCGESGGDWPSRMNIVPSGAIHAINNPSLSGLKLGINTGNFTTTGATTNTDYGFFEIIIEGKDANGNTVTSDIGFLPYRKLEYIFKIEVLDGTSPTTVVTAGKKYSLRVTVQKSGTNFPEKISEVAYDLLSDPSAFMYTDPSPKNPLVSDKDRAFPYTYPEVYFTHADSNETISAAGVYVSGSNRLPILGTLDIIVKPGTPEKVKFIDPIPLVQLGTPPGPATVINRGVDYKVSVEVQDRYGNAVDVPTPVSIVSSDANIGDVGSPSNIATKSVNSGAKGIAVFTARVTNGKTGDNFDMTATIQGGNYDKDMNVGRLRLGRALDRLDVFYSDTAMTSSKPPKVQFDAEAKIDGNVGDWFKITVRDVIDDTINVNQKGKVVQVSTDADGLVFSATQGGAPAKEFALTNGVAVFWVTGTKDVSGCVDVVALDGSGGPVFNGISPGNRCDITFIRPSSSIVRAIVYGDGHGRPDSLRIYYADGGAKLTDAGVMPDKVMLTWPVLDGTGVEMTVTGAALTARDSLTLHVNLAGVAARPAGFTSISGQGRGLVAVYGGSGGADAVEDVFEVFDGIGPVLAKEGEAGGSNPIYVENLKPGVLEDTLIITVSEQIRDVAKLKGATLLYTKDANPANDPATGGSSLTVVDAFLYDGTTYKVVVSPVTGGLGEGNWIRFDPAGGVADRAAQAGIISDNTPHANNRWVQLKMQEVAPSVVDAWYTANSATGKVDYAYVVFDKAINLGAWFEGGKVKFDKDETSLTAAVLPTIFSVEDGNTLKIDLALAYKSSQSIVRTSSPMSFTLSFATGKGWGTINVNAQDKAAPVLADAVTLKIGSLKEDNTVNPDTLVVVFSENPSEDALKLTNPITIYTRGGECKPELKLFGQVVPVGGSLYYRATYVVNGDLGLQCASFPEIGDSVNITASAGFGDNMTPPNVQSGYNLKQVLKIDRGPIKWAVTVRNNPFRNDAASSGTASVKLEPGAKGAARVDIKAQIMIFDNLGAVVVDTLINAQREVDWPWNGTNKRGRLVGTGTYLFKAVCEADILNASMEVEKKERYAVTRSLGVVRGGPKN